MPLVLTLTSTFKLLLAGHKQFQPSASHTYLYKRHVHSLPLRASSLEPANNIFLELVKAVLTSCPGLGKLALVSFIFLKNYYIWAFDGCLPELPRASLSLQRLLPLVPNTKMQALFSVRAVECIKFDMFRSFAFVTSTMACQLSTPDFFLKNLFKCAKNLDITTS